MSSIANRFRPGVFVLMKYPEKGKVKSRLAKSIGEEAAMNLYRAFIQDTLKTVRSLDIPFYIAVYPPESEELFEQWLGPSHRFFRQKGINLGERLRNGFSTMFEKGYHQVIALASDCPDLPIELLQKAVYTLQSQEIVIGPAPDGGYYLIGFSKDCFHPVVFDKISWGSDTVFQETLKRIESVTSKIHILREWPDIDTKSHLRQFYKTYQLDSSNTLHSMKYLHSHPKLVQILFS